MDRMRDDPMPVRPEVRGKFLWIGDRKLWVKGVTYGTFRPGPDGVDYPSPERVEDDFAGMAAAGFNTVRTYTPPPGWLLDIAHRHRLYVMIGLPWEQHIAFLDDRDRADSIVQRVREAVRP
jgi:O-antigen biosynthesis protein